MCATALPCQQPALELMLPPNAHSRKFTAKAPEKMLLTLCYFSVLSCWSKTYNNEKTRARMSAAKPMQDWFMIRNLHILTWKMARKGCSNDATFSKRFSSFVDPRNDFFALEKEMCILDMYIWSCFLKLSWMLVISFPQGFLRNPRTSLWSNQIKFPAAAMRSVES